MTDVAVVLARPGARLTELTSSLVGLGIEPVVLEDLPPSQPLRESLSFAIDTASFVIVVWDSTRVSRSIMFAAGYAVAKGVRIALLDARPGRLTTDDPLVEELLTFPRLNAPLSSRLLLDQEISAFIDLPHSESALYREPRRPSNAPVRTRGSDLEERAIRALTKLDINPISARTASLEVPDWKIWVDGFTAPFNPVFVEVIGLRSRLEQKRGQLVRAMTESGAHLGVLIAADEVEPRVDAEGLTAVCTISLLELELEPRKFEQMLRIARNRLLHGPR